METVKVETTKLGGELFSAQILGDILTEMRTGAYAASDRLPPEVNLAAHFGVSRTVIRDVLSELQREGYIERVRGIGTVINRRTLQVRHRIDQQFDYNAVIRESGFEPGCDCVYHSIAPADETAAATLGVTQGSMILCVQKRILAGSRPVCFIEDHYPLSQFKKINFDKLDYSLPSASFLQYSDDIFASCAIAELRATMGSPEMRHRMELKPEAALLELNETVLSRLCKPVRHSFYYFTDFFNLTLMRRYL